MSQCLAYDIDPACHFPSVWLPTLALLLSVISLWHFVSQCLVSDTGDLGFPSLRIFVRSSANHSRSLVQMVVQGGH